MTDFAAWNKFSVEDALKEVDEQDEKRERETKEAKQRQKNAEREALFLKQAQRAASALMSQAEVASLRASSTASCRGRRRRRQNGQPEHGSQTAVDESAMRTDTSEDVKESAAALRALFSLAEAAVEAAKILEEAISSRDAARKFMEGADYANARACADVAGALAGELMGRSASVGAKASSSHDHTHDHSEGCSHGDHAHSHGESSCNSNDGTSGDSKGRSMRDVLVALQTESQIICSRSAMQLGRLAEASNLLRDILKKDPKCDEAWTVRAEVFRQMHVPLLARMHADQALRLNQSSFAAEEEKTLADQEWFSRNMLLLTPTGDNATETVCEQFQRGVVLHQEQFFLSARTAFCFTLSIIEGMDTALAGDPHIRNIWRGCHLNIAAGHLLQHRNLGAVVRHCDEVLLVFGEDLQALVWRSQAHDEIGDFGRALADLQLAKKILDEGQSITGDEAAEVEGISYDEVLAGLEHVEFRQKVLGKHLPDI